ncbi:MAG: O-antigen ligase family protein [Candidatus Nitrotoga sp.]
MQKTRFRTFMVRILLGILWLAVALSPLHSWIAAWGWLMLGLLALAVTDGAGQRGTPAMMSAATAWLTGSMISASLWTTQSIIWQEPCCKVSMDLDVVLRLMLAAVSIYVIARACPPAPNGRTGARLLYAIVLACALAFLLAAIRGRHLPVNPIPWAVAISFLVCLLLPRAFDAQEAKGRRWLWGAGVFCGLGSVLLSQSRGAFGVLLWVLFLAIWMHRRHKANIHHSYHRVAAAALLSGLLVTAALNLPGDPMRLNIALQEVKSAVQTKNYNTSLGARIALFRLGWEGFVESPWIGLGATERARRIHRAGDDLPADQRVAFTHVRVMGHVHNQYMNNAIDGGLVGLLGLLALQVGLWVAAHRLGTFNRIAGLQLWGVGWMHALAGLSNVNLAHNYYVLMLALSVGLVFVMAWADPTPETKPLKL